MTCLQSCSESCWVSVSAVDHLRLFQLPRPVPLWLWGGALGRSLGNHAYPCGNPWCLNAKIFSRGIKMLSKAGVPSPWVGRQGHCRGDTEVTLAGNAALSPSPPHGERTYLEWFRKVWCQSWLSEAELCMFMKDIWPKPDDTFIPRDKWWPTIALVQLWLKCGN